MKHVALLIESSRSYGRGLLEGIAAYVRFGGAWSLRHQEMSFDAVTPAWLHDWEGDGILARIESAEMAATIHSLGIPAVDLRCWKGIPGAPQINTDDEAVVRMAIDHLRHQGLDRFAFCGFEGADYSVRRLGWFRELMSGQESEPPVYESEGSRRPTTIGQESKGMLDTEGVTSWLKSLVKPIGLVACNDIRAQQVLQCCADAGIAVPDDIAVIGVDNDEVICGLCHPNLSSVDPNTHQIGYDAAALLDRMMNGGEVPTGEVLVPPNRVMVRGSTDVVAIEDRTVAAAYRYLREHACEGISVEDVVKTVPISRRSLERRMRHYFGHSPSELIADVRVARIKQLLEETDFPLKRIAGLAGFTHDEHMAVFFRKQVGDPPGKYRKSWRAIHAANDHS
ncbi:substrate-binding domain-containing protein [Haloferula sp.]|uniref:AraC family transcriptional regulator n=1 Tax=Haloferula sp. TaxID=2497595 RepID=UPI0032A0CC4E